MAQAGAEKSSRGNSQKVLALAKVGVEAVRMPVTRRVPIGRSVGHVVCLPMASTSAKNSFLEE